MASQTRWTPQKRGKFLAKLAKTGNVSEAARVVGVSRARAYEIRAENESFAAAWDEAIEQATDELEAIARKRASTTSDTLLIFLLKGLRPEKYRERLNHEHTGANGSPLVINIPAKGGDDA